MALQQIIFDNLVTLIIGLFGIAATVATIRLTMRNMIRDISHITARLNNHSDRIKDLEVAQAERFGYERGVREAKDKAA